MKKALAMILLFAGVSVASEIEIQDPWVKPAKVYDKATAAMMIIKNNSDKPDYLIGGKTDVVKKVEIHSLKEEKGTVKMVPIKKLEIPAKGSVELSGSYHIMLIGLKKDLNEGDTVKLKLKFKNAGEVEVDAPVKNQEMKMEHHHH